MHLKTDVHFLIIYEYTIVNNYNECIKLRFRREQN